VKAIRTLPLGYVCGKLKVAGVKLKGSKSEREGHTVSDKEDPTHSDGIFNDEAVQNLSTNLIA
jgi:hypothetical protein